MCLLMLFIRVRKKPFQVCSLILWIVLLLWLGYVDTDMTSHKGLLTVEEGAKAPLFLALDADLKGKYVWNNCSVVAWDKEHNL